MNAAQTSLYFREWGLARAWYVAHGIDPKQPDNKRHELHRKALGRDKSSKDFNNDDLDKVLAAFRAVHDGGNLDAQLQQLDQPENRRRSMEARIFAAGEKFISGESEKQCMWRTIDYCRGIWKKLRFGGDWQWPIPDTGQLAKVMGIVERRARQVASAQAKAVPASAREEDNVNPF